MSSPTTENSTMLQRIAFRLCKCLKRFTLFPSTTTRDSDTSEVQQPHQGNLIRTKYILALNTLFPNKTSPPPPPPTMNSSTITNSTESQGTLKDAYRARCRVLNAGKNVRYDVRNYVKNSRPKISVEIPIRRFIDIEIQPTTTATKTKLNLDEIRHKHIAFDSQPVIWQSSTTDCSTLVGTIDQQTSAIDHNSTSLPKKPSSKRSRSAHSLSSIDEISSPKKVPYLHSLSETNSTELPNPQLPQRETIDSDPDWCFDLIGPSSESESSSASSAFDSALTNLEDVFVKAKSSIEKGSTAERKRIAPIPKLNAKKPTSSTPSPKASFKDVRPCFVTKPTDCTVKQGETARFVCYPVGDPRPNVQWFLNKVLLKPDGRIRMGSVGFDYFVEIDDVVPDESGRIKCLIENCAGSREAEAEMHVKSLVDSLPSIACDNELAPKILTPIKNIDVIEGQCIKLKCKIFGNDFDIRWYHNGSVLARSDNVDLDYRDGCAILQIKKINPADTGVLTCLASNIYGEDKSTAIVRVSKKHQSSGIVKHGSKDHPNLMVKRV